MHLPVVNSSPPGGGRGSGFRGLEESGTGVKVTSSSSSESKKSFVEIDWLRRLEIPEKGLWLKGWLIEREWPR